MAHLLMLHGHPVGYLPPTYASEILTSGGDTVEQAIDDIDKKFAVQQFNCTGVASTSHSSGWFYADYEITLGKSYSNGMAIITGQRGVPLIAQADVSGNKLYIRIWALSSFTSSTSFGVRVMVCESTGI